MNHGHWGHTSYHGDERTITSPNYPENAQTRRPPSGQKSQPMSRRREISPVPGNPSPVSSNNATATNPPARTRPKRPEMQHYVPRGRRAPEDSSRQSPSDAQQATLTSSSTVPQSTPHNKSTERKPHRGQQVLYVPKSRRSTESGTEQSEVDSESTVVSNVDDAVASIAPCTASRGNDDARNGKKVRERNGSGGKRGENLGSSLENSDRIDHRRKRRLKDKDQSSPLQPRIGQENSYHGTAETRKQDTCDVMKSSDVSQSEHNIGVSLDGTGTGGCGIPGVVSSSGDVTESECHKDTSRHESQSPASRLVETVCLEPERDVVAICEDGGESSEILASTDSFVIDTSPSSSNQMESDCLLDMSEVGGKDVKETDCVEEKDSIMPESVEVADESETSSDNVVSMETPHAGTTDGAEIADGGSKDVEESDCVEEKDSVMPESVEVAGESGTASDDVVSMETPHAGTADGAEIADGGSKDVEESDCVEQKDSGMPESVKVAGESGTASDDVVSLETPNAGTADGAEIAEVGRKDVGEMDCVEEKDTVMPESVKESDESGTASDNVVSMETSHAGTVDGAAEVGSKDVGETVYVEEKDTVMLESVEVADESGTALDDVGSMETLHAETTDGAENKLQQTSSVNHTATDKHRDTSESWAAQPEESPLPVEQENKSDSDNVTPDVAPTQSHDSSALPADREVDAEPEEDSWDAMFDEDGESLDPQLLEELTTAVGNVDVQATQYDYYNYQPKELELDYSEYGHLIEIYDFPKDLITRDLIVAFNDYKDRGFDIKWVDDAHAIGIFASNFGAHAALSMAHPFIKVRPISQATRQTKDKAKRCVEFLQPYKERPETSASVARNLVAGALGIRNAVARDKRSEERKKLQEAREKKRSEKKQKRDAWEGSYGRCAMDEET